MGNRVPQRLRCLQIHVGQRGQTTAGGQVPPDLAHQERVAAGQVSQHGGRTSGVAPAWSRPHRRGSRRSRRSQSRQVDAMDAVQPVQLGDGADQGGRSVRGAGPLGREDQQPAIRGPGNQIPQQLQRTVPSPVHVLQDQDQRSDPGCREEHLRRCLEQLAGELVIRAVAGGASRPFAQDRRRSGSAAMQTPLRVVVDPAVGGRAASNGEWRRRRRRRTAPRAVRRKVDTARRASTRRYPAGRRHVRRAAPSPSPRRIATCRHPGRRRRRPPDGCPGRRAPTPPGARRTRVPVRQRPAASTWPHRAGGSGQSQPAIGLTLLGSPQRVDGQK